MGNTDKRLGIAAMSALAAAPAVAAAHDGAQAFEGHHGMMWNGFGGWFMGPLMMLLFVVLAVVVVAAAVRWLGGHGPSHPTQMDEARNSAREILEQRFARGEIDEEEFRRRRQALDEAG